MKINFIIILLFCLFNSCSNHTSKNELLNIIYKQDYLLKRSVIISFDRFSKNPNINNDLTKSIDEKNLELSLEIPLRTITEKDIQISDNQISVLIPSALIKERSDSKIVHLSEIIEANALQLDNLKKNMQNQATVIMSNIFKKKGFKMIKIRFND